MHNSLGHHILDRLGNNSHVRVNQVSDSLDLSFQLWIHRGFLHLWQILVFWGFLLLWVDTGTQERGLPCVDLIQVIASQLELLVVLVDIPGK